MFFDQSSRDLLSSAFLNWKLRWNTVRLAQPVTLVSSSHKHHTSQHHLTLQGGELASGLVQLGTFLAQPANLDVLTPSNFMATAQKKVSKFGIHNMVFEGYTVRWYKFFNFFFWVPWKVWLGSAALYTFWSSEVQEKVLYEDFGNSIIGFSGLVSLEFVDGLEGWVKVLRGRLVGGGGSWFDVRGEVVDDDRFTSRDSDERKCL